MYNTVVYKINEECRRDNISHKSSFFNHPSVGFLFLDHLNVLDSYILYPANPSSIRISLLCWLPQSSSTLLVLSHALKVDSNGTADTRSIIISWTMLESIGYIFLCDFHQSKISKTSYFSSMLVSTKTPSRQQQRSLNKV